MARLRWLENARAGDEGTVCTHDNKLFFDDTGAYIRASASGTLDLVATTIAITGDVTVSGSLTTGSQTISLNQDLQGTLTVGVNDTGYDVKFYGATASKYWLWDEDADSVILAGAFAQTGNMAITGTFSVSSTSTLTGAIALDGAATCSSTLTVGVSDTGYDVKFYGATAANYMHWDESGDDLLLVGTATQFAVAGTTNAVSATTGSIRTAGGIGIVQDLWVGGLSELVGAVTISAAVGITGAVSITGNVGITGDVTMATNDKIVFYDATQYIQASTDAILDVVGPTINLTASTIINLAGVAACTDTTEASAVGTASMYTAGGLGVTKKAYIGTDLVMVGGDIDFSTATTGLHDIIVKDNLADALSIKDNAADLMVFTTTTGGDKVAVVPNLYCGAAVTSTGHMHAKTTVTSKTSGATVTYTAAEIVNCYIIDAITQACAATTHTGTELIAAIPNAVDGSSFFFYLKNTAGSAIDITLTAGVDVTVTGTATVGQNNTKMFFGVVTSVGSNTVVIYSLGTMVH